VRLASIVVGALVVAGTASADPAAPAAEKEAMEPTLHPPRQPGDRRIIAVLDVHVGDGVPPEIAQQFQRELEQMVSSDRYWLAPRSRVHELMMNSTKWTEGCMFGPCIADVRAQTGADVALLAALSGSGTSFGSVITIVRTDNGHVLAQDTARCDVCTVNEAIATASRSSAMLLDAIPVKLPAPDAEQRSAIAAATAPLTARVTSLEHARSHRRAAYTLCALGAVAIGTGLAIYDGSNKPPFALALAGGGAGLALSGLFALSF
jgi:hypothetical protein